MLNGPRLLPLFHATLWACATASTVLAQSGGQAPAPASAPAVRSVVQATTPRVYKVEGLPKLLGNLRGVAMTERGLVVVSNTGVAVPSGTSWTFEPSPTSEAVQFATMHPLGLVVAQGTRVMQQRNGVWERLPIDDTVNDRMRLVGSDLFIPGVKGLYRLDAEGRVTMPFALKNPPGIVGLVVDRGELFVLGGRDGYFFWRNGELVKADSESVLRPNAPGARRWVIYLDGGAESLVWDGTRRYPRGPLPADPAKLNQILATFVPGMGAQAYIFGQNFYGISKEGVECYSLVTGERRFVVPQSAFGGTAMLMSSCPEGVLVMAQAGVYLLLDPDRVSYEPMPSGAFYRAVRHNGRWLALTYSGPYYLDNGERLPSPLNAPLSAIELPAGDLLFADLRSVAWAGKTTQPLGVAGSIRNVHVLSNDEVLISGRGSNAVLRRDGTFARFELGADTWVGRQILRESGELAQIESDGTVTCYDLRTFQRTRQFGTGITMALLAGGQLEFVSADGTWYGENGQVIARAAKLPVVSQWNVSTTKAGVAIAGRGVDGARLTLRGALETHHFRPLDLPYPEDLVGYLGADEAFLGVMSGQVMIVRDVRELAVPRADVEISSVLGPYRPGDVLPARVSQVEVQFPRARLHPWTNPTYSYRIDDEEWQTVPAGARVRVARLPWSKSQLEVRASQAGYDTRQTYTLYREFPWWASWPGFALGAGLVSLLGYGIVRWRTAAYRRQAERLEAQVAERTVQLEEARRVAERASAVKGDFIASINHEIRNPMNGIVGVTRILAASEQDLRRRRLLATLESCTEQLRATMDDVLDFDAIERGQVTVNRRVFDVVALIESCRLAANVEPERLQLVLPAGPIWIEGDAGKLRQIVSNYLGNALKYGSPPGGEVRLAVDPRAEGGVQVRVEVSSAGPTLGAAELGELFNLFYRGSRAKETNAPGTGIGLALCRRFARAMGGETGVTSAEERTTFWVSVPCAAASAPEVNAPLSVEGQRVLAVEDESYNRLVVGHYLAALGVAVDWASSGAEALDLLRAGSYGMILTDWFISDMTGGELLLRAREAGIALPPVVAVSASATGELREAVLAAGIVEFIPKPVDEAKLRAALLAYLPSHAFAAGAIGAEAEPSGGDELTLGPLLTLGPREEVLPKYCAEFSAAWREACTLAATDRAAAAAALHRLRSQALVVRALPASRALGELELRWSRAEPSADEAALLAALEIELPAMLAELQALPEA